MDTLITVAGCFLTAGLCLLIVVRSLRDGMVVDEDGVEFPRTRKPINYWLTVGLFSVVGSVAVYELGSVLSSVW